MLAGTLAAGVGGLGIGDDGVVDRTAVQQFALSMSRTRSCRIFPCTSSSNRDRHLSVDRARGPRDSERHSFALRRYSLLKEHARRDISGSTARRRRIVRECVCERAVAIKSCGCDLCAPVFENPQMAEAEPTSPLLNRDDASSDGNDAGTNGLSALARRATGGALFVADQRADRLTRTMSDSGLCFARRGGDCGPKKRARVGKQNDDGYRVSQKGARRGAAQHQRAHAEIRRLNSQESAARKSAKGIAYSAILATVPVAPHDRVLVRYTNPKGLVAIGAVQPRPTTRILRA